MKTAFSESIYGIGVAAQKLGISLSPTFASREKEGLIVPRRTVASIPSMIIETVRHPIHDHGLNFTGIRRLMVFLPFSPVGTAGKLNGDNVTGIIRFARSIKWHAR